MGKGVLGLAAQRALAMWRRWFLDSRRRSSRDGKAGEVVLFVDTFNNYSEPENARAALAVLDRAGYGVHVARAGDASNENARPLCCGRTFLAAGMGGQAEAQAQPGLAALQPYLGPGGAVVGLRPSFLPTPP